MEKEYKGLEIENPSLALKEENLVGALELVHQGKIGGIKIKIEGQAKFIPMVEKAIDKLEEIIPGDQKAVAEMLKAAVKNLKIKF